MKTFLTLSSVFLLIQSNIAQEFVHTASPYYFETSTETYTPLQQADTILFQDSTYKDRFQIGFSIIGSLANYDTIEVQSNELFFSTALEEEGEGEYLFLDNIYSGEHNVYDDPITSVFYAEFDNQDGKYGIMEFNDFFAGEDSSQRFTNQIWFFENGDFEYHFGPNNLESNHPFETIGFKLSNYEYTYYNDTITTYSNNLEGSKENVQNKKRTHESEEFFIQGMPGEGTIFRFIKSGVGVEEEPNASNFLIKKTLTTLFIETKEQVIKRAALYDLSGRIISLKKPESNKTQLSLRDLQPGIYLLNVTTNLGAFSKQIMH